jgi:hypothetical protein
MWVDFFFLCFNLVACLGGIQDGNTWSLPAQGASISLIRVLMGFSLIFLGHISQSNYFILSRL